MYKKFGLGNLFHKREEETENTAQAENSAQTGDDTSPDRAAEEPQTSDRVYLPESSGAMLKLWERWSNSIVPPTLSLTGREGAAHLGLDVSKLERERLRIHVQLEQDAKKRLNLLEKKQGTGEEEVSLNGSCHVYLSKDKMVAWAFFFPPIGPEGTLEASQLGAALQSAGVTTGIDSNEVVRLVQNPSFFELFPVAIGTPPVEGKNGEIVELYARELEQAVSIDETGTADYHAMNYVRQIEEGDAICNILPPQEGTPGVQVDGKVVDPRPVRAARPPKGINTAVSEDGRHLVAARAGHLEFADGAFQVRPLLEVKGDVDYSTGDIEFNGDLHIHGDVREGFTARATGTITVDGLVEAATVEAGKDLIISRGVVGDQRALLKSGGCVRAKYLENCVLYADKAVYADCIMTSQIFSDDSIHVTSGRGSVIGGALTAAQSIHARMIGAQSGRLTELTLGVFPYVQEERQTIQERLDTLRAEKEKLLLDLAYLENKDTMEGSTARLAKARMRKYALDLEEKKLEAQLKKSEALTPDLSKCRLECDTVYPVTSLTVGERRWCAEEVRHRCKIRYDVETGEMKEII